MWACAYNIINDQRPTMIHVRPHQETRPNEQREHANANTSDTPLQPVAAARGTERSTPPKIRSQQALNTHTRTRDDLHNNLPVTASAAPTSSRRARESASPATRHRAAPRFSTRIRSGRCYRPRDRKATREHRYISKQTNQRSGNAAAAIGARQRARAPPTADYPPHTARHTTRIGDR